ncbi:MAG: AAA family ATPase, partial [Chitinispirillia bacterium]
MPDLFLSSLQLQNFRNYENLQIKFSKEGALLLGENGSGKTNLLESIYFLSLGRSQRGASKQALIHSLFQDSYIEGIFKRYDTKTAISIGFSRSKKIVIKKNNQKLRLFSEIFNHVNIVSFGPQDIQLVYGDPSVRRKFLDMIISQTDAKYLENLILFKKYLLNRNKLLIVNSSDRSIEIYEEKMAELGAYIYMKRLQFFNTISTVFTDYLNTVNLSNLSATIHYYPSFKYNE